MGNGFKDLKINGIGQVAGGVYGSIVADGLATINGDVVCDSLTSNGTLKVKKSIEAGKLRMNGTGSASESIRGGELRVDGMLKVDGHVRFVEMDINGMLTVNGGIAGEHAKVDGGMKTRENAEFESLKVHGQIRAGGMINAGELEILLEGNSQAREIGGERIVVKRKLASPRRLLSLLSSSLAARLSADSIEGDIVELEETRATIVRGNIVKVGPGCEIERIEYRQHCEIDPRASVRSVEQV
ncbi:hypothetical protein [Paenibacillus lutimineralis]|uniref:Polymer-forming cytoskeletal protein n=1 Tax=Paenibacillus lutimineralis TaxID=2707005 RepID=A0A3Q9IF00_9BACL|nr:hypothetical protein [Paenibacillus lutimineralis]AZS17561.1 hypothetical protein EI981_26115 [Paenibacillus lutimineralis]